MQSKQGLFKAMYVPKINMNGSTYIYSVKAKSQAGNI